MNGYASKKINILQSALCMILCAAMVIGLLVPAVDMVHADPENPLVNEMIRDIEILQIGENSSDMDDTQIPEGNAVAPTEPEETEPEETEETEPEETEETEPEETEETEPTEPEETEPQETSPEDPTETTPEQGEDDEGNDDGNQGEVGGEALALELAAVMTWYKYGTDPNSIVCGPSGSVNKSINTAQLADNTLKYSFTLNGEDSRYVDITNVELAIGEGAFESVSQNGTVQIQLAEGNSNRNYTFRLTGYIEKPDDTGEVVRQELTFTFVLKCGYAMDLDMELTWRPTGGNERKVVCGPDKTEAISVKNYDLTERVFGYTVKLAGSLAEDAEIISARYTTASGQKSGELTYETGTLILDPAPGKDTETYQLIFTVRAGGKEVTYQYKLIYQETLDAQLNFHWMEKGTIRRTKTCEPGETVSEKVKNNQLSAGAVAFEMELVGADGSEGRILSVTYTSDAGDSGNLKSSGSLPMVMPAGKSSNTYRISVSAMVKGQRLNFEIILSYSVDVSIQMEYTVLEDGAAVTRQIVCENTKSKTADAVYDDQLSGGALSYAFTLIGEEAQSISITSVRCFQSGSGKTVTLGAQGSVVLLLKNGKTGENTFGIEAKDDAGNVYRFTVNIPFKHRGENKIKIQTNLTEGQEVINDTKTNLTVQAWSEDENGNVISYIPANGTDTKLIVKLDGEILGYISSSGAASEYDLYPGNPEVGDTNTHVLYVYAEDALGNYGELTLNLNGQRRESGQKIGTATIYVDMTVLGLGVVASVNYDVLADEPVSYVIEKAILGKDTGEPFGKATQTLGWSGTNGGTVDIGYYLQSLTTGYTANALEGAMWPGSTEQEVLQAIDNRFGAETGLAILWRCLYRNGLNKSAGSGSRFGEMDYTSGSGWMYSIGGAAYYPGQSMSSIYLQDGDVLTIRYTLAYGWDVGGGTAGYGSTVGYCVSAINGSIRVNHRMETIVNPDGSISNVCYCCGIVADCAHADVICMDLEDGYHIQYCNDCKKEIGDPAEHIWVYSETEQTDYHACTECGAKETHNRKEVEGTNTANCTEPGVKSMKCVVCNHILEEQTGPKGHTLDNQWQTTAEKHYEKCSTCGEIANEAAHQYVLLVYVENGETKEDFECSICHAMHIDDCAGTLSIQSATCQKVSYHCDSCGYDMAKTGVFEEYHSYENGACLTCNAADPNWSQPTEPTEPEPTEPEPTEPEPTEPEPTEPESQPTEPEPTEPESQPTEPEPTEPESQPTEPEPTEPESQPTEPAPTEPEFTVPEPSEPEQEETDSADPEDGTGD